MLAKYASISSNSKGRLIKELDDPIRNVFQRDRDRIIHSTSFKRLQYKTQVFVNHEGDLFRTRLTHSIEVAQVARVIAKQLKIQEELTEALALAHDLGHTPFGHAGEKALNYVMGEFGGFNHNAHSLKIVNEIEEKYAQFKGLNLTWETLEGLVKHNGPINLDKAPTYIKEFCNKVDLQPNKFSSLEAQVASIADDIAYNNHDIEDGIRANLLQIDHLKEISILKNLIEETEKQYKGLSKIRLVHHVMRRTMNYMIQDVIRESNNNIKINKIETIDDVRNCDKALICFSEEVISHNKEIRTLLINNVYEHYLVNRMTNKAQRIVKELFRLFYNDPKCLPTSWQNIIPANDKKRKAIIISDYIAGMTDRFAINEYNSFINLGPK